jgi:hypothetical protein
MECCIATWHKSLTSVIRLCGQRICVTGALAWYLKHSRFPEQNESKHFKDNT